MSDITTASLVLSFLVIVAAGLLGWREWIDRRDRDKDLSPEDLRHFGHQNSRRMLGLLVLIALALGLIVGSRIPSRIGNQANPPFLGIWMGIFLLIFLLLTLAMIDWIALRLFARRHRNEILRERIEILKEGNRRRKSLGVDGNGHPEGPVGDLYP